MSSSGLNNTMGGMMGKPYPPISYNDYLQINPLLSLQKKKSAEYGAPAHDEMLFIIIHQTYELWFKQILTELDSVMSIFSHTSIDETDMGRSVSRLQRIVEIMKLLVSQVTVLETMTPLDFLDFRDYLYPASGFQSAQYRLIENKLGLRPEARQRLNDLPYKAFLDKSDQDQVLQAEKTPSLFELVNAWLARTPFLHTSEYDFWESYRQAVQALFEKDRRTVESHPLLNDQERERSLKEIETNAETFAALFDENRFAELQRDGVFRLSYQGLHAALLIHLYRDQPALNLPFQFLLALQDIDELMTTWRYRHALMAHRMLGRKVGTGGSSGAKYLKMATEKHRVFSDFFNLATFLIPRSSLPELPESVKAGLGFFYSSQTPRTGTPPGKK